MTKNVRRLFSKAMAVLGEIFVDSHLPTAAEVKMLNKAARNRKAATVSKLGAKRPKP